MQDMQKAKIQAFQISTNMRCSRNRKKASVAGYSEQGNQVRGEQFPDHAMPCSLG